MSGNKWETTVKYIRNPTSLGSDSPSLYVPRETLNKIDTLSHTMDKVEWGGYLIGEGNKVQNLAIPEQIVSGATWKNTGEEHFDNIIGTVHSHHTMNASPSGTDTDYIGAHHNYLAIFSYNDGLKAWKKVNIEEAKYTLIPVNVTITGDGVDEEWLLETMEKIKEKQVKVLKPGKGKSKYTQPKNYKAKSKDDYCNKCGKTLSEQEAWRNHGYCNKCIERSIDIYGPTDDIYGEGWDSV